MAIYYFYQNFSAMGKHYQPAGHRQTKYARRKLPVKQVAARNVMAGRWLRYFWGVGNVCGRSGMSGLGMRTSSHSCVLPVP